MLESYIFRGLFKTSGGLKINDDVLSTFNQIRKYRIAIGRPINMASISSKPDDDKSNGVVAGMLRPIGLRIEKLLSEGSRSLISMIPMNKIVKNVSN